MLFIHVFFVPLFLFFFVIILYPEYTEREKGINQSPTKVIVVNDRA